MWIREKKTPSRKDDLVKKKQFYFDVTCGLVSFIEFFADEMLAEFLSLI